MHSVLVGEGQESRKIAVWQREAQSGNSAPELFWLGGLKSDMNGSKAQAVDRIGERLGVGVTRFDYSGHGLSGGSFIDGTISRWLEEALAVFKNFTTGSQIVIGSSMGAWLAFLLNNHLRNSGNKHICSIIVIAPAIDMTSDLMAANFSPAQHKELETTGQVQIPSDYDEPYVLTKNLISDGATHELFNGPIATGCPVHILQGRDDKVVPYNHALKLVSHLLFDPVTLTLVPEGDHSLSRERDLDLLENAVAQASAVV